MDTGTVVLAAATAVVAVAQAGILATSRAGGRRDLAFLALPAAGAVALCVLAWLQVAG